MSGRFDGVRAVVVGAGVAGASAARVLLDLGAQVLVTDARDANQLNGAVATLEAAGADVHTGGHAPRDLDDATLVVVSPGVTPDAQIPTWARDRGIPVWGELELGAQIATVPYLAVTGTNGKTTTTGMIASCLTAAGMDAVACGNIGHPFPEAAAGSHEVLVVEASSFQLSTQSSFHPVVSVLLNLDEDHVDWHGSTNAYRRAKARIFAMQTATDAHVGNRDDARAAEISATAPCPVVWIRTGEPADGEVGYVSGELTARLDAVTVSLGPIDTPRAGYREDAAAAAAAALSFGAPPTAVIDGLANFVPAAHRGDVVAEIEGVRFIDNSKATNVHAALAAIAAVDGPLVLIAGGRAKGQDLAPLGHVAGRLDGVVAIGESAEEIVGLLGDRTEAREATSMKEATRMAFERCPHPGTVLLAPACASWDMYADYRERGDDFAACARALGGVQHA
ncbi:MAG: UDP-N-acetylmuramoylalanine--D-glutamate ligase [Actinomycetota bacterium]|jgi:UDP-N-acetylmuramoylalanine--D-glutamate ligase|nr:UDP-N-acetylmuramoylalanine--D-glutamate ligase [Actinomycetota bacterium]